jgi:hypothetical protein
MIAPWFTMFAIAFGSWIQVPGGDWQPSPEVMHEVGGGLRAAAEAESARTQHAMQPWSGYTFQFQGVTEQGRRQVLVAASCRPLPEDASKRWLVVYDGGTCYFAAYYDPDTQRFVRVRFHGVGG